MKRQHNPIFPAEKEIDETFFPEGEEAAHVTEQVHMKPSYVKGLVKADWTLDQYNAVDVDGTIREDQLESPGRTCTGECGTYL